MSQQKAKKTVISQKGSLDISLVFELILYSTSQIWLSELIKGYEQKSNYIFKIKVFWYTS